MKILNKSYTGTENFICEGCGSGFSADENEYKVRRGTRRDRTEGTYFPFFGQKVTDTDTPVFQLKVKCPVCSEKTTKEVIRGASTTKVWTAYE